MPHPLPQIVLASSSPYRKELLQRLQLPFTSHPPDVDETPRPHEHPAEVAERLAITKAQALQALYPDAIIIGSDQVASLHGQPLGKPGNREQAIKQLSAMQQEKIIFHTGLCVTYQQHLLSTEVSTLCVFRHLSPQDIERYVDAEPAFDVAGSAKIESLGISLLQAVHSDDPSALIGLPLIALTDFLHTLGFNPLNYILNQTHD